MALEAGEICFDFLIFFSLFRLLPVGFVVEVQLWVWLDIPGYCKDDTFYPEFHDHRI